MIDRNDLRRDGNRFGLHGGDHRPAHALLLQVDDVGRLQGNRQPVGMDVVDDQAFIDPGTAHGDDVGDRHGDGDLPAELGLDQGAIAGFGFVHSVADGRSAEGTHAGAHGGPGACVAQGVTYHRSRACSQQSAEKRPLLGMVRGLTTGQ